MPGMNSGIKDNGATVAAAFEAALRHQVIVVLLAVAVLGLAWLGGQAWRARATAGGAAGSQGPGSRAAAGLAGHARGRRARGPPLPSRAHAG